jgi:hypothetical protein
MLGSRSDSQQILLSSRAGPVKGGISHNEKKIIAGVLAAVI